MSDQREPPPAETTDRDPALPDDDVDQLEGTWDDLDADEPDYPDENVLDDWIVYPSMAAGIVVTTFFPILLGQTLCLPVLSAAVLIPMFLWALRRGRPRKAITLALFWVVAQSLAVIVASLLFQDSAWRAVQGGLEYRSAWLAWIEGGPPVQMAPSLDFGRQAVELVLYALAMALSAGVGGLLLLTLALDRFNFTVASMLAGAESPAALLIAAWPVWMTLRVIGYLIVGAVLAEPLANLDLWPAYLTGWLKARRRLLLLGFVIILLGVLTQVLLAPLYQTILHNALG